LYYYKDGMDTDEKWEDDMEWIREDRTEDRTEMNES